MVACYLWREKWVACPAASFPIELHWAQRRTVALVQNCLWPFSKSGRESITAPTAEVRQLANFFRQLWPKSLGIKAQKSKTRNKTKHLRRKKNSSNIPAWRQEKLQQKCAGWTGTSSNVVCLAPSSQLRIGRSWWCFLLFRGQSLWQWRVDLNLRGKTWLMGSIEVNHNSPCCPMLSRSP